MIDFEEELKKFHPSLEVEDAAEAIYGQDLTDVADILIQMVEKAKEEFKNKFGRSPKIYDVVIGDGARRLE